MRDAMKKYFCRSRTFRIAAAALRAAVVLMLLLAGASQPALAQIMGDLPTVRNVALGPSPKANSAVEPMVLLTLDALGNFSLTARLIERSTGDPVGLDVTALLPVVITPVDMLWSRILRPGSLLVLDTEFFVREFTASYAANGQLILTEGLVFGPYGDPATDGVPTALAEAPAFFAAVGTSTGKLIISDGSGIFSNQQSAFEPIVDLAVVPQVGHHAIVLLIQSKSGSRLLGINPDSDASTLGPQPTVTFDLLAYPAPSPKLETITGAAYEPTDVALTDPADVNLVASNGESVFRVTIPADSGVGGRAIATVLSFQIVQQLALGSLVMVPPDGSGVLYDPGFILDQGGISGTLRTIYGHSAQLAPSTLSLSSRGQSITAVIEVAGGGANSIEPRNIVLEVNGGFVKQSLDFAPQLGDEDKDGNADLKVKFDRATVQSLLTGVSGTVPVTLRWQFSDGSSGAASAQMRVIE